MRWFTLSFAVIFMAVYHAWKNKPAPLAGVLVPAGIMLSYGAWVVVLAKRDKRNRAIFVSIVRNTLYQKIFQFETV